VTYNPSRKQFFAKLLGVVAGASLWSKRSAKSDSAAPTIATSATRDAAPKFELHHDTRAVSRGEAV
jgi:hypothetical protein